MGVDLSWWRMTCNPLARSYSWKSILLSCPQAIVVEKSTKQERVKRKRIIISVLVFVQNYLRPCGKAGPLYTKTFKNLTNQAEKEVPQPQVSLAFGLLKTNPLLFSPSVQSI